MTGASRWSVRFLLLGGIAAVVGCEEKLTYERWQLINQGSTKLEVESAIGQPDIMMPDQWTYVDHDRGITAHIYFEADANKVHSKQWIDAEHGWQGKNPAETDQGDEAAGSQSLYHSESKK